MAEKNQTQQREPETENHSKSLIEWTIPEFVQHERSRSWYIVSLSIVGLFLLYAIINANFLFALLVIMVVVIYYLHMMRTPAAIPFAIYEDGILVGHRFSQWKEIKSFWILYDPPEVKKLYFEFKFRLRPFLSVPLEKQNPIELRNILKKHLGEDLSQEEEPASEQWEKILKL